MEQRDGFRVARGQIGMQRFQLLGCILTRTFVVRGLISMSPADQAVLAGDPSLSHPFIEVLLGFCRAALFQIPSSELQGRFAGVVRQAGCAIVGATADIAPADKRLYAIRDVTATVESIDLITASILSKKLAAGLGALILDVKVGSGAFMATMGAAEALAQSLVSTANGAGCKTAALITDMDQPLAPALGNALEVAVVMEVLTGEQGAGQDRLVDLPVRLGAALLALAGVAPEAEAAQRMRGLWQQVGSSDREIDDARAAGDARGPLAGLPVTLKESFNVKGLPTVWGNPDFPSTPAQEHSAVAERVSAAGAIILGKTNASLMLANWDSENPVYGRTSNPWNLDRVPGGSSGGAAAALSSGLSFLEVGSDLGGSIRQPAANCGVYGHKPTAGVVPQRGHMPTGAPPAMQVAVPEIASVSELPVAGPMARSAADLHLALNILGGPDGPAKSALSYKTPQPRQTTLKAIRVG